MKRNQIIKALESNGIVLDSNIIVTNGEIELTHGYHEINGYGGCDGDAIDAMQAKIQAILPEFASGFTTGYGSFIMQLGAPVEKGDWNDVSSMHHY